MRSMRWCKWVETAAARAECCPLVSAGDCTDCQSQFRTAGDGCLDHGSGQFLRHPFTRRSCRCLHDFSADRSPPMRRWLALSAFGDGAARPELLAMACGRFTPAYRRWRGKG